MIEDKETETELGEKVEHLSNYIKKLRYQHEKEKVDILNALEAKFGSDVKIVLSELVATRTREAWASIAQREKVNSIDELIRVLWEPMKQRFTFSVKKTAEGTQIYCTHCPLAELAKDLNASEWGDLFYCQSDYYIVEGFNPKIGFRRSKTLMAGDDCCDHFYYMKDE